MRVKYWTSVGTSLNENPAERDLKHGAIRELGHPDHLSWLQETFRAQSSPPREALNPGMQSLHSGRGERIELCAVYGYFQAQLPKPPCQASCATGVFWILASTMSLL
jgi:hypothetical protein